MALDSISFVLSIISILLGFIGLYVSFQIKLLFNPGITKKLSVLFILFISMLIAAQLIEIGREILDLPMVLDYFRHIFNIVGFAIFLIAGYEVLQFGNIFGFRKSAI